MSAGRVRAYVCDLYREAYDAACSAQCPLLDIRIIPPKRKISKQSTNSSLSTASVGDGNPAAWPDALSIETSPDLEVILSDETLTTLEKINEERISTGMRAIQFISLEDVASKAYCSEYYYAEDARADIPSFTNVSTHLLNTCQDLCA